MTALAKLRVTPNDTAMVPGAGVIEKMARNDSLSLMPPLGPLHSYHRWQPIAGKKSARGKHGSFGQLTAW